MKTLPIITITESDFTSGLSAAFFAVSGFFVVSWCFVVSVMRRVLSRGAPQEHRRLGGLRALGLERVAEVEILRDEVAVERADPAGLWNGFALWLRGGCLRRSFMMRHTASMLSLYACCSAMLRYLVLRLHLADGHLAVALRRGVGVDRLELVRDVLHAASRPACSRCG